MRLSCMLFLCNYYFVCVCLMHRLSWGLLYAALVTTMSVLMAVIATWTPLFSNSNFLIIFLLIFLYGISTVSLNESILHLMQGGLEKSVKMVVN